MTWPRRGRLLPGAAASLAALLGPGCREVPREVAYDLAARTSAAERWSSRDVFLFGTPAAEPALAQGFHREAASGYGQSFVWSGEECELALRFGAAQARVAILDLAPFRGVKQQSAVVLLNGRELGRFALNDTRHRYRLDLPALAQVPGDNRLRFRFASAKAPAEADPSSNDRRRLAAAFYGLVVGEKGDAGLEDLLAQGAPRPFEVGDAQGVPALTLVGPSVVRFALRLPEGAELRFTPSLHPGARAAATGATVAVLVQAAGQAEAAVFNEVLRPEAKSTAEVRVPLPGKAGDIVRVGLAVGSSRVGSDRFAWATFEAPRVLGRGAAEGLPPPPLPPEEDAKGEGLGKALQGSNVVFVILDAGRARSFSTYGYGRPTTPEVDSLARDGVVFENAATPAVYTLGAMSSVWTSQYPDRHHSEVSFAARLPKDRLTLAEMLTARGVHTAGFVANAVAGSGFGFDRGFAEFHEVFRDLGSRGDVFRKVLPQWLQKNRERRFFLYVHFREPHFPYDPEPPFDTRFGPEGPIPKAMRRDQGFITEVNQGRRKLSSAEREHLVRLFDGNLAFADQEVGALVQELRNQDLFDKTVVIVAADHGEGLFEHGWIGHNVQLYEESTQVPLIVRFPGGKGPRGRRIPALVDLLDVAPTVAQIFGLRGQGGSERAFQGRSLLPVVEGAPGKPVLLSRTVWDRPRYALRDARYKFLFDTRTGEGSLFDLAADPGETKDVAAAEPVRTAYYRESLHTFMRSLTREAGASGEEARLTKEQCENLKALGYAAAECSS